MLVPCCNITIGNLNFRYVSDVQIDSGWATMTNTCVIKMARNLKLSDRQLRDLIRPGDKVTVKLGYDHQLDTDFTGYVVKVKPTIPLEIYCEDEMYQLKKGSFTHSFPAATKLNTVIEFIYTGSYSTFGDITLGAFTLSKATAAQVLEEIKKVTGLVSFFRNGILTIGKPYDNATLTRYNYVFNYTRVAQSVVAGNVIVNDLEYRNVEDIKVKVEAISMQHSGGKRQVTLGDAEGETHTLHCPNDLSESELHKFATQNMQLLKAAGYRGTITTFGYPRAVDGDVARLSGTSTPLILGEQNISDHNGSYFIDKTVIHFGQDGYKRVHTLGAKTAGYLDFNGSPILPTA